MGIPSTVIVYICFSMSLLRAIYGYCGITQFLFWLCVSFFCCLKGYTRINFFFFFFYCSCTVMKLIKVTFAVVLFCLLLCFTSEATEGSVYNITARNYRRMIYNPKNTVFLFLHTSWCASCPQIHPVWEELGDVVNATGIKNIFVGRIDNSKYQDVSRSLSVTSFPSFLLFTPTNKTGRLRYEGEPSVEGFTTFLRDNGVGI